MFYKQPKRIFGPPVFGNPIQRGEGFGNFFSSIAKLAKKVIPNVSRVAKKVLSSDIVKEGSKKLLDHGMDFATNLPSDVISGEDISESAQRGLQEARQKIAQTIRDTCNMLIKSVMELKGDFFLQNIFLQSKLTLLKFQYDRITSSLISHNFLFLTYYIYYIQQLIFFQICCFSFVIL